MGSGSTKNGWIFSTAVESVKTRGRERWEAVAVFSGNIRGGLQVGREKVLDGEHGDAIVQKSVKDPLTFWSTALSREVTLISAFLKRACSRTCFRYSRPTMT